MKRYDVLFLHRTDAYRKASRLLLRGFVLTGLKVIEFDLASPDEDEVFLLEVFCDLKIVVLSCGGRDINRIIDFFIIRGVKPTFVSLFPGIVASDQVEAFVTRIRCDLVLLNSIADMEINSKVCSLFNAPDNGVLFGASWFSGDLVRKQPIAKTVVFFDQAFIPETDFERRRVAMSLVRLAARYPDYTFLIKPRLVRGEGFSGVSKVLNQLVLPRNIEIFNGSVDEAIDVSTTCISISSSALIEAILCGRSVFVISDFNKRKYFSYFYNGSGLQARLDSLDLSVYSKPNQDWLKRNVISPIGFLSHVICLIRNTSKVDRRFDRVPSVVRFAVYFFSSFLFSPRSFLRKIRKALRLVESGAARPSK